MPDKKSREKKEMTEARRRRGFGDDLFYRNVQRFSVEKDSVLSVTVGELGHDGVGLVRIGLLSIMIPGSKIGEKLKIKIVGIRGRFADAEIIERI